MKRICKIWTSIEPVNHQSLTMTVAIFVEASGCGFATIHRARITAVAHFKVVLADIGSKYQLDHNLTDGMCSKAMGKRFVPPISFWYK